MPITDRYWHTPHGGHSTVSGFQITSEREKVRAHGNQTMRFGAKPTRQRKRRAVALWRAHRRPGESFKAWVRRRGTEKAA